MQVKLVENGEHGANLGYTRWVDIYLDGEWNKSSGVFEDPVHGFDYFEALVDLFTDSAFELEVVRDNEAVAS